MKAAETTKGWPLSPDSMEAILPTKKMVVEAELVSSEVGRGYKKAKEVPEMAEVVTEEVGMALEVLVIRTSKANQTNNRTSKTSTMTSKLLNKLFMYYYLSSQKCHSEQYAQKCPSEQNPSLYVRGDQRLPKAAQKQVSINVLQITNAT